MDANTCLIERSLVRARIINLGRYGDESLLQDIDDLPIVTFADKDAEIDRLSAEVGKKDELIESFRKILDECENDFHECQRCGNEDRDATRHSDLFIMLRGALNEQATPEKP